jgi:hypothetical protein
MSLQRWAVESLSWKFRIISDNIEIYLRPIKFVSDGLS